jgi:glycosyltransferase involved in cell wall biosynthesis
MTRSGLDRGDHVVVISQLPPPVHGSTVMTEVFLRSLDELEIEWTLVDRRFSASVDAVGKFTLRKIISAFGLANRLIKALVFERHQTVVFFCTTRSMSFVVDWFLSEIVRLVGTKNVNYIHTQGYKDLADRNALFSWMTRRLLTAASKTVCLSQSLYNDISPWVARDSVWFIANTLGDLPELPIARSKNPRHVTFLSNLISGKGIDVFLDIAIDLAPKYRDVIFDVVGAPSDDGQIPQLEKIVRDAGLADRFNFAGPVHGAEKWKYLQNSTLLVFPSRLVEAQPLTIIEAFASGTPVVAFGVGGIVDLVKDGETGALVKPGSKQDMLSSIDELLSAPELLDKLGQCALDEFEGRFSAATYTTRWSEVLTS